MRFKNYTIACAIPFISIIFDLLVMHAAGQDFQFVQYSRAIIMFSIIILYVSNRIIFNVATISILTFLLYILAIILFREIPTGDYINSIRWFSRVSISMLLLFVGFSFINTEERLNILNKFTIFTGASIIIYLVIVNVFDIGISMYLRDEDMITDAGIIRTGLMGGVGLNTISYILLLVPFIMYVSYNKIKRNTLITLLFVLLFLVLFLVLRRSALLIVLIGYLIYLLRIDLLGKKFRRNALIGIVALIVLFPIYTPYLFSMYEIRGDRALSAEAFDQDTRAREIPYLVADITTSENLSYQLFGKSFNTTGVFTFASADRSLHSDISNLLYITGFTGLVLYLFIHFAILIFGYKYRKYAPKIYFITVFVLVFASILLMYPGRLTALTYRSIMYLYVGSILGTMYLNYKKSMYGH